MTGEKEYKSAVIDTGAPISIIPSYIWQGNEFDCEVHNTEIDKLKGIQGIGRTPETPIPCRIG
jgi:hypothetical protein